MLGLITHHRNIFFCFVLFLSGFGVKIVINTQRIILAQQFKDQPQINNINTYPRTSKSISK